MVNFLLRRRGEKSESKKEVKNTSESKESGPVVTKGSWLVGAGKPRPPDCEPVGPSPEIGFNEVTLILRDGEKLGFVLRKRYVYQVFPEEEDHTGGYMKEKRIGGRAHKGDLLLSANGKPPEEVDLQTVRPLKLKFYRRQRDPEETKKEEEEKQPPSLYSEVTVNIPDTEEPLDIDFSWTKPLICITRVGYLGAAAGFKVNDIIHTIDEKPIKDWREFIEALRTRPAVVIVRRKNPVESIEVRGPEGFWNFIDVDKDKVTRFQILKTKMGMTFRIRDVNKTLEYFENARMWVATDGTLSFEYTQDGMSLNFFKGGKMISYCCWSQDEGPPFFPPEIAYPATWPTVPPELYPGGEFTVLDHWIPERPWTPPSEEEYNDTSSGEYSKY